MHLSTALKEITRSSVPLLASSCMNVLNNFISLWIVAKLGALAIAASALISSLFSTLFVLAAAILYATSILIGQSLGQKQPSWVGKILQASLLLATLLGIFLAILFIFSDKLLLAFHQSPDLAQLAAHYFRALTIGLLPMFWGVVLSQFFMGIGKARLLLYTSCVTTLLCPLLTWIFVLVANGDAQNGLWGAGMAASITSWVMLVVMIILLFQQEIHAYCLFARRAENSVKNFMKKILALGIPMMIQYGVELCALTFSTLMLGWIGNSALAAQQIVTQFTALFLMIPFAISQALAILVGQQFRENHPHIITTFTNAALLLGTAIMLLVGIIYVSTPWFFIHLYHSNTLNPTTTNLIVIFFAIVAVSQLFDCGRNILSGTFRGLSHSREPMWIGILGLWGIALPSAYYLGFYSSLGAIGIRLGVSLGIISATILLFYRYFSHIKTPHNYSKWKDDTLKAR